MRLLLAIAASACTGGGGTDGRATDADTTTVSEPSYGPTFVKASYNGPAVHGMLMYAIPGNVVPTQDDIPDIRDDPPYILGTLDTKPRQFANTLGLRDQCVVSPSEFAFEGKQDIGASLAVGVGSDTMTLTRRQNEFGKGQVLYIYNDTTTNAGLASGNPIVVAEHDSGVVLPEQLALRNPQDVLDNLLRTGQLTMEWEPVKGEYDRFVNLTFASYDEHVSTASEFQSVVCQFVDDGFASIDMSQALQPGWLHHIARFGRTSHGFIEHASLGSMLVYTVRDFRVDRYDGSD